ncbi:MAG: YicC family protein [Clostridia bacterium]|nr:YicC family protein [Clostridia bacterium]
MIKSMTGFGRSRYEKDGRTYTVEIKSVNHKYTDVSVKLPRFFSSIEDKIRKEILNSISRGKVDVFITFENYSSEGTNIRVNRELAKEYIKEFKLLAEETGVDYHLSVTDISKLPEILKIEDMQDEDKILTELMQAVNQALEKFVEMRTEEGKKLISDIEKRIYYVREKIEEIKTFSSTLVEEYMQKLELRVKELMKTNVVDEARLAQEIVIFSDKSSVEEELTRLESHISQILKLIKESSPIGKKMDFLIQEMNREVNTIGSKANSLEITNRVIDIKTEIENIREQIQNIE